MTQKFKTPVWLVTGCSSGFGRALVTALLEQNMTVVATARHRAALDIFPDGNRLLKVALDVTKKDMITAVVAQTIEKFGRIDVLVNNAGFGYFGVMEESDQTAVRRMMETNFWGANDMTRAVLPHMRTQKSGRILNITSRGGLTTTETLAYYHATKFAMEGLFQTLRKEVEPLGIFVTNIEPGSFRTDWAGRSKESAPERIKEYESAHHTLDLLNTYSGTQSGNPALAAKAMIKISQLKTPPMHYLMGKDAYHLATSTFKAALEEFELYHEDAIHLDFGDEGYWLD